MVYNTNISYITDHPNFVVHLVLLLNKMATNSMENQIMDRKSDKGDSK